MSIETTTDFSSVDSSKDPQFFLRFLDAANKNPSVVACQRFCGPGIPQPSLADSINTSTGHRLPDGDRVTARPILGGLHHEYRLERQTA